MKLDDHKNVRRNIREWLTAVNDDASDLARDTYYVACGVVMCGGIAHEEAIRAQDYSLTPEYEDWFASHRKMWCAALVRALKRHRRWAAVKKMLIANVGPDGKTIIEPEYHAGYVAWLNSVR